MKKKNKVIFITLIVITSIVILGTIFYILGTVDYIRANNGKKPIFTYHTVNVTNIDVAMAGFEDTALPHKEGAVYYGIGYSVSICDIDDGNYTFQLGHKQKELCSTSLTCIETDDLNIKRTYEYSFFDGKLYRISKTHQGPIDKTYYTSEEMFINEKDEYVEKINNIKGCGASYRKINETELEITEICNLSNMSDGDIYEVYQTHHASIEQPNTTREEIIDYYHNWMKCE